MRHVEISALDLSPISHLENRLLFKCWLASSGVLDGRSGLEAPLCLQVLKAAPSGSLGWTDDYHIRAQVQARGHEFFPGTISQAFASGAEADAYLLGARTPWPAPLHRLR